MHKKEDLEMPLISQEALADFGMTAQELSSLFVAENIRDGSSLQMLLQHGRIEGLMKKLKTNSQRGLDGSAINDIELRIKNFGDNKPQIKKPKTLLEYIVENFEDPILRILCAAAFVNLVIGVATEGWQEGWLDGMAIFIAVIIIVSVTAGNNYLKDQQFRKLNAQAENRNINVRRNGHVISMSIYDLLVGDIIIVDTGEILPVDGVLFEASDVQTDESSITGETNFVKKSVPTSYEKKDSSNPFLISSSRVMDGTGELLVLAVGENSFWGNSKKLITSAEKDGKTPLEEKLAILADQIGEFGLKAALITFAAMTLHLFYDAAFNDYPLFSPQALKELLNFFIIAVTIIVVAVPEGLPLAVTIALAYSVGKMKDENNLVRWLSACETMGGANTICSDKTGTLTENRMTVTNLFIEENDFNRLDSKNINATTLDLLCQNICLNSSAHPQVDEQGKFDHIGNKTECAMLEMAFKFGFDFRQLRKDGAEKIKRKFPFSSERKRMSIVVDYKGDSTNFRIFVKGAPDVLIERCTHYLNSKGSQSPISEEYKKRITACIKSYANQSLRSILLAYKETLIAGRPQKPDAFPPDTEIESKLCIIGVTGLQDPLKEGIPRAVQQCKEAGVIVRMVTGDNIDTAIAISKKAGILPTNYTHNDESFTVLEGKSFRQLVGGLKMQKCEDGKEVPVVAELTHFQDIARELRVLARSSPEDKFLLVTGLKQLDNVVAVTGDGTNDAPALKKADVGFAMGIQGTEVAKDAAGIILLDDNFASIVTAMKWGRNIFDCIRKFLQFQVTVNIVAVFMAFLGGVVIKESPLTSIQMLWVNLIMDTLASLALATEPPNDELLRRQPYRRRENMITPGMWRNILCQALFQILVLITVLFKGDQIFGVPSSRGHSLEEEYHPETLVHYTLFFHIFVFMQVFNEINARKLKKTELNVFQDFFNNNLFISVILGTIIVQVCLVEYGGKAVKVTPLTVSQHITCIFIGMMSLIIGYFIKLLPDSLFNSIGFLNENEVQNVDPSSLQVTNFLSQGRMKRPSTLIRKRKSIESKRVEPKLPQASQPEIELKMGGNNFK